MQIKLFQVFLALFVSASFVAGTTFQVKGVLFRRNAVFNLSDVDIYNFRFFDMYLTKSIHKALKSIGEPIVKLVEINSPITTVNLVFPDNNTVTAERIQNLFAEFSNKAEYYDIYYNGSARVNDITSRSTRFQVTGVLYRRKAVFDLSVVDKDNIMFFKMYLTKSIQKAVKSLGVPTVQFVAINKPYTTVNLIFKDSEATTIDQILQAFAKWAENPEYYDIYYRGDAQISESKPVDSKNTRFQVKGVLFRRKEAFNLSVVDNDNIMFFKMYLTKSIHKALKSVGVPTVQLVAIDKPYTIVNLIFKADEATTMDKILKSFAKLAENPEYYDIYYTGDAKISELSQVNTRFQVNGVLFRRKAVFNLSDVDKDNIMFFKMYLTKSIHKALKSVGTPTVTLVKINSPYTTVNLIFKDGEGTTIDRILELFEKLAANPDYYDIYYTGNATISEISQVVTAGTEFRVNGVLYRRKEVFNLSDVNNDNIKFFKMYLKKTIQKALATKSIPEVELVEIKKPNTIVKLSFKKDRKVTTCEIRASFVKLARNPEYYDLYYDGKASISVITPGKN